MYATWGDNVHAGALTKVVGEDVFHPPWSTLPAAASTFNLSIFLAAPLAQNSLSEWRSA